MRPRAWVRAGALAALLVGACRVDLRFDDSGCGVDADCRLSSLHCLANVCVACVSDAHCTTPGLLRCDTANHRCVECGLAGDCSAGKICKSNRCVVPCTSTATCSTTAPICDDGSCLECDDGVGCKASPVGPTCLGHFCVQCATDAQCSGAAPRCDVVTHKCVACAANVDCPAATPLCDVGVGRCVAVP